MFLVVVDVYSKWVELVLMHSTTSDAVIRVLRALFATHGLPDLLVSDNGPQLTASVFKQFLASWAFGIASSRLTTQRLTALRKGLFVWQRTCLAYGPGCLAGAFG